MLMFFPLWLAWPIRKITWLLKAVPFYLLRTEWFLSLLSKSAFPLLQGKSWISDHISLLHCPLDFTTDLQLNLVLAHWCFFVSNDPNRLCLICIQTGLDHFTTSFGRDKAICEWPQLSYLAPLCRKDRKMTHGHGGLAWRPARLWANSLFGIQWMQTVVQPYCKKMVSLLEQHQWPCIHAKWYPPTPHHFAHTASEWLGIQFPGHWLAHQVLHEWPTRSPDLTSVPKACKLAQPALFE